MQHKFDFLVIGTGIGGLSYALKVADFGKVAIITKSTLNETNTSYAQGGIAAVTYSPDDFESHIHDTMIAGDGLNDGPVVRKVITEAPSHIQQLIDWGVDFDKTQEGLFDLHREGGHSQNRIFHSKDKTGAAIQDALIERVKNHPNIKIYEKHFSIDIITQHHLGKTVYRWSTETECYGAYVLNIRTNRIETFLSRITIIATGGVGSIYAATTNPLIATGDGIAMVYRAKGIIEGMEFVQFHPTSLYNTKERPSFLITEAMRGYGAELRTKNGQKFMHKYDERGSLAPRDIVARAIDNELKQRGDDFVYLDVTHKTAEETKKHFPNISKKCLELGIDITKEYIPVVPAAHYLCGGIKVNQNSKSSINRLYAVGECASTGLHGANRLASNSLLEALVFADSAAKETINLFQQYKYEETIPNWNDDGTSLPEEMILITQSKKEMASVMSSYVGIVRTNLRLKRAFDRMKLLYEETEHLYEQSVVSKEICELRNAINVSYLIIKMAMHRRESRGLHYNLDYPEKNDI